MKYLAILFFVLFTLVALVFWQLRMFDQERCDYIETLASNPRVVTYIDQWAMENVVDKNFYFVAGMGIDGNIAAHRNNDEKIHYVPLPDNKITGIEDRYFRFSIEKYVSGHHDPIVSSNVHSMYFGRGRDHIIITKNGHTLTSYRGHDMKSQKLKIIGPSVYAYCSSGRFRM
ncbi:MAG: hypothetical protein KZQ73_01160 [Candidatus Thiodiazotropha sp. (ex Semelilucina semeliformis)]|nr:hypothetical protein [Candidatus Thiodiazotropha sp. (ex Semelilucina semeliformis)]